MDSVWLRLLPMFMLATSTIAVPLLALGPEGLPRTRALETELSTIQNDNASLRRDIAHLRSEVQSLREDPSSIERIARDQLGMVRKSEVVFQFPREANR
jgi:cell division protein FtsB